MYVVYQQRTPNAADSPRRLYHVNIMPLYIYMALQLITGANSSLRLDAFKHFNVDVVDISP